MARPVVGGHFAWLTLGRACGGKAVEGLSFLEDRGKEAVVEGAEGMGKGDGEDRRIVGAEVVLGFEGEEL